MNNEDLFKLLQGLNEVAGYKGARFAYAVARNIDKLTNECKLLEKQVVPSEEFQEFENKRLELAKGYCDKNEDGSPVTKDNMFVFNGGTQMPKELADAMEALVNENKDLLEARNAQISDFNVLLKDLSDFVPYKLKEEFLPDDITAAQMVNILPIID